MKTTDIYDYFGYWLTTAAVGSNNNECDRYYTDFIPPCVYMKHK